MNGQPVVIQGYYLHYKNKVYRLLKFATTDNDFNREKKQWKNDDFVIYQPQYRTPNLPDYLLWARPSEMFFQNMPDNTPRFRYLGKDEEEVKSELNRLNIKKAKPVFKKENIFNKNIAELVQENYAIQGFALHSETLETQILYNKNGTRKLLILPEKEFFQMSKLNPEAPEILKYLLQIKKSRNIL